jgi:probable HAF family extracellular repeat protein
LDNLNSEGIEMKFLTCYAPLSIVLSWSLLASGQVTFEILGDLPGGGNQSYAKAVSADGSVIAGDSMSDRGYEVFKWADNVFTPGGDLPGGSFTSWVNDISSNGSTIVGIGTTDIGTQAFVWTNTGMANLEDLIGVGYSAANGVSADGSVIVGEGPSGAFRLEGASVTLLEIPAESAKDVSDDGLTIVGTTDWNKAFRWVNGTMETDGAYLDPGVSAAYAVSPDGSVTVGATGSHSSPSSPREGFYWIGDTKTLLDSPESANPGCTAWDVSDSGKVIVGTYYLSNGAPDIVIWRKSKGYTPESLSTLITDSGYDFLYHEFLYSENAVSVSSNGRTIVGTVRTSEGYLMAFRLGLEPDQEIWAGFPVEPDGRSVDTGNFLGWVDMENAPWIFCYTLDKFIYLDENHMDEDGAWTWVP